jgi:hypothetical protein
MLKDRVTELKAIRNQARADTERAEGATERQGPTITSRRNPEARGHGSSPPQVLRPPMMPVCGFGHVAA